VLQAGGQLTVVILLLILVAIAATLTVTKKKMAQVRMCKNKTILLVFVTLILVYFMCYTSIWMQAMEFKGSFEKRVSSNVQQT
jgi:O-antigen ligase